MATEDDEGVSAHNIAKEHDGGGRSAQTMVKEHDGGGGSAQSMVKEHDGGGSAHSVALEHGDGVPCQVEQHCLKELPPDIAALIRSKISKTIKSWPKHEMGTLER